MVTGVVWPLISSVLSTFVIGGVTTIWRSAVSTHKRLDKIEEHLRRQDTKILKIERKLRA